MRLIKPCERCYVDTWQDEFITQDNRVLCGMCFLVKEARNEGYSDQNIAATAALLYDPETVREVCREAGVPEDVAEAVIAFAEG